VGALTASTAIAAVAARTGDQAAAAAGTAVTADTAAGTNNGRLVARLVPVRAAERSRAALIESGALVPARRPRNLLDVEAIEPADAQRSLSEVLREMRDEQ
jgi:antitoxin (DNA-binding transcriptional repressor) of toxin-antitoxin stability system